ncbi:NAD(P)-binding protein [Corynespora cassiicola Philippines]|uniref:NAD(P)-binding protein n=1 Tax=Corynespora cassiicola Philippines TaxID=1448308 RepID=A0A2T2PB41_CORCC|nr:NAD(P)-binding protein [Corynespora cassiicola Philippines]
MAPFPSPTSAFHSTTYPSLSPTRPELSAKGKSILITGGGTGIGSETALYFAKAGASRLALLGRREQPLLDTKASIQQQFPSIEIFTAPTDVTNKGQVDAAFAKFAGSGKIDVVVSNAAVRGPMETVRDVDTDEFLAAVDTNIRGSFYVAKATLAHGAKDAVVIEVNSAAAHLNMAPGGLTAYSASKLAVFRLWDSLGFANPDMSVFHTHPGIVDTDMNKDAGGVKAFGYEDHASLPASFHVWLASPEAKFLKGKFLYVNWDVDELKAQAKDIESGNKFDIGLVGWPFGDDNWKLTAEF